jgi:heat shock protein HtpX
MKLERKTPSATRIWVNIITATALLMVVGYLVAGRYGLLFGFVLALLLNFLVFLYPTIRLFQLFPNQLLEGQDPDSILSTVNEFSQRVGIPSPSVYTIELDTPICYSAGLTQSSSAIFISEGMIQRLEPRDIKAALAFEVARIYRFDTLAATVSASLAGALSVKPLRRIAAPIVALVVRIALRRKSFYEADYETARLLDNDPKALARLLWKLDSYSQTLPLQVALPFAHLFIVTPLTGRVRDSYLSLQPSVRTRISRLIGHYPI